MENSLSSMFSETRILEASYIEDDVVRVFHAILQRNTSYRPRDLDFIQHPELIAPLTQNEVHLQILYRGDLGYVGHWVCIYYNAEILRVYDSLLHNHFCPLEEAFISNLFPFNPPVQYVDEQKQTNFIDCKVFAIAYATSIA